MRRECSKGRARVTSCLRIAEISEALVRSEHTFKSEHRTPKNPNYFQLLLANASDGASAAWLLDSEAGVGWPP